MSSTAAAHGFLFLLLLLLRSASGQSQLPPDPRSDPNQNQISGSMAVIVVILIAALFFMAFFSVYIRHCNDSSSTTTTTLRPTAAGRSRRATRGLDPALIETFPTLIYSEVKEHKIGKSALECAVCLSEFEDDETLRLIPKCDHVFHPECIDAWLVSHCTCPVCRADLNPPQLSDSARRVTESDDLERAETRSDDDDDAVLEPDPLPITPLPEVVESETKALNRNRTRGSRSTRLRWLFPRSHSTGHSLVQPGEDTERFTLRLPVEIRKQLVNRKLNRATSMVVLASQSSSMRGYRFGSGEGSSRGKYYRRLERLDRTSKSDRWVLSVTPPFFTRMSSMKTPRGGSNRAGEAGSDSGPGNLTADSNLLPSRKCIHLGSATFATTILAVISALASFSDTLNSPSPTAQLQVFSINWFQNQRNGNDEVFVFLGAEYETPKNSLNQISLWDGIIPSKEIAKFQIHTSSKYRFVDQGSNLRGKEFNLTLQTGKMFADKLVMSGYRLPQEYKMRKFLHSFVTSEVNLT